MFRDFDGISTSVTFFPKIFIDDKIKKRVDETRDQLASDKMAYYNRHYIHCLQHDHFWMGELRMISISYLSTVNTLTSSFEYMKNGGLITA